MTAEPASSPPPSPGRSRPLTGADSRKIGEVEPGYTELEEGRLLLSPSPRTRHSTACSELWLALRTQPPSGLRAVQDIDVDLQLAPPEGPGTVRRPDVIVVSRA